MREIRFRAFDEELKLLVYGDDIEEFRNDPEEGCENGAPRYYTGLSYGNLFVAYYDKKGDWQECQIMQFTGLKDKTGRDIYEGDIIEWSTLKFPITVDEFHGYRFMFGKDQLNKATAVYGEIIGNIFENPELLEVPK